MTPALSTILFDMDNTLFDFVGAQIAACTEVAGFLEQDDGNTLFDTYFRSGIHGYESHLNIRDYMADRAITDNGDFMKAVAIYERVKLEAVVPYEGVEETLAELRSMGYLLAVITDAHSRDATRRLEKAGVLPHIAGLVSFDMVMAKKPSPVPFLTALGMMQAGPENALLVGDSPRRDIRPAASLGITTVYARYGDRSSPSRECPEADYTIDRMPELLPVVRSLLA